MPDINGFELLELLRTSNVGNSRDIPVIVTTASGSCGKEVNQNVATLSAIFVFLP